jgi:NADPH:quinone reductase-like Zn-dependent oxidoreductase
MKAAVLHTLGKPPRFEDFPEPKPSQGEVIVHVRAAPLKNVDKMMASGSHYDRYRELRLFAGSTALGLSTMARECAVADPGCHTG